MFATTTNTPNTVVAVCIACWVLLAFIAAPYRPRLHRKEFMVVNPDPNYIEFATFPKPRWYTRQPTLRTFEGFICPGASDQRIRRGYYDLDKRKAFPWPRKGEGKPFPIIAANLTETNIHALQTGFPKTGTSLLQYLVYESILDHYNLPFHLSPSRLHGDIKCLKENVHMFREDFAAALNAVPNCVHPAGRECASVFEADPQARMIYTVRKLSDSIRSVCKWAEGPACNVTIWMHDVPKYVSYYQQLGSEACQKQSAWVVLEDISPLSDPHKQHTALTEVRRLLDYIGLNAISDNSIKVAISRSSLQFMADLEEAMALPGFDSSGKALKSGTGAIKSVNGEWTEEELDYLEEEQNKIPAMYREHWN